MGLFSIFKKEQKTSKSKIDNLKSNELSTKDDSTSKAQKIDEKGFQRAIEYVTAGIISKNKESEVIENLREVGFSNEQANNFYIDCMESLKKGGFIITNNILMDSVYCADILFKNIDSKKYSTTK